MKIEKWLFKGEEIEVLILDKDEIETNEVVKELENTLLAYNKS